MFIDSHCHLDNPALAERLTEVLAAARRAGVTRFVVPGVSVAGWDGIAHISATRGGVFAALGLHPMNALQCDDQLLERLAAVVHQSVAIGEIGLDYLIGVPRDLQQAAFRQQLRMAVELGLPVMLHCRRAFADLLKILREEKVDRVGGVMHAFSGSVEVARECIGLGLAIGVAGPVTFRNSIRPLQVVHAIPLDHLLLETDAPDLAPEPHRGSCNEPSYLVEIARTVAAVKGVALAEVARVTTANAERVFRLTP